MESFPPSQLPPRGVGPVPILLSLFFSFFFCPTHVRGDFLAFWEISGLLPAFSRCSVGVVPHVDVIFDVFMGRKVISTSYSSAILKVSRSIFNPELFHGIVISRFPKKLQILFKV